MHDTTLYTIGFARKPAEAFFELLKDAGVRKVIDVRLHNTSQMAGFTKRDDLRYFLSTIGAMDYRHLPELAPTPELLDAYRKKAIAWETFEPAFVELISSRHIEATLDRETLDRGCLLCSEPDPQRCHRRLVAEYLRGALGEIRICHL
ncbi:MAG: DUF488 family protein [Chitinivibrionales bacterium]|nr:DUF488 family protein [Chitinivibrionales bacterium]